MRLTYDTTLDQTSHHAQIIWGKYVYCLIQQAGPEHNWCHLATVITLVLQTAYIFLPRPRSCHH